MKNKIWKKPTKIIYVNDCKYCGKEITNDMSFLAFYGGTHAHFDCDRKEYYKQLIEKEKNEKGLSQN